MAPNNPLPTWGNEKTMNLNPLILTNIQSSPYFKVNLYELKTYHEVIDEIYYKVSHLEPWEKGSRKTAGQTGMCGGVRGVGAGGIVSSAYCLLYKLFTLKLTRKQVNGLLTHCDSPYIRGLGFMYIRYTQPPQDLWTWYEDYLFDDEEVDVKAGGGCVMTIGEMLRQWLMKLEWFSTLFPRIPVPVQKSLDSKLRSLPAAQPEPEPAPEHIPDENVSFGEAERQSSMRGGNRSPVDDSRKPRPVHRSPPRRSGSSRHSSPPRHSSSRSSDFSRELAREKERQRREKDGSREQKRSRSRERHSDRHHDRRTKDSEKRHKHRSRSRSRERRKDREERRDRHGHRSHKSRNGDF